MDTVKDFNVKNKITSTKDTSIVKRRKKGKLGDCDVFATIPAEMLPFLSSSL